MADDNEGPAAVITRVKLGSGHDGPPIGRDDGRITQAAAKIVGEKPPIEPISQELVQGSTEPDEVELELEEASASAVEGGFKGQGTSLPSKEPPRATPDRQKEFALARKERELQAWADKLNDATEALKREASIKAVAKDDIMSGLEALGIDVDDPEVQGKLVDALIVDAKDPARREVRKLRQEMERDRAALRDREAKLEADEKRRSAQASVDRVLSDIRDVVGRDDRFELVRAADAEQDVLDAISYEYERSGTVLTIEEAALVTEDAYQAKADRLLATKKLSAKTGGAGKKPASAPKPRLKDDREESSRQRIVRDRNDPIRRTEDGQPMKRWTNRDDEAAIKAAMQKLGLS